MNEFCPASDDGRFPCCIYTKLPIMPEAWRASSSNIPVDLLVKMSQREHQLRVNTPSYQNLFKIVHGAPSSEHSGNDNTDTSLDEFVVLVHRTYQQEIKRLCCIESVEEQEEQQQQQQQQQEEGGCVFYKEAYGDYEPMLSSSTVILLIQLQVLAEFGFPAHDPSAIVMPLYELRTAGMLHPEVSQFQQSVQFFYNKAANLSVPLNTVGPDCTLYDPLSLRETSLHQVLRLLTEDEFQRHGCGSIFTHHPVVVISGSYT